MDPITDSATLTELVRRWGPWAGLNEIATTVLADRAGTQDMHVIESTRLALVRGEKITVDPVISALAALSAIPAMLETHRTRDIGEDISRATAADIGLWVKEHYRKHGAWGLSETGWIRNHLSGRLFRLGRLQFISAPCNWPLPSDAPLRTGDLVLEVHISAGEPLLPDACMASFAQAEKFYPREAGAFFTCSSWLLGPKLSEVLSPVSNVLAFQRLFQSIPFAMDDRQTCERVFDQWPLDLATAQQSTTMQRAILEYYRRGGKINGGAGYRARSG